MCRRCPDTSLEKFMDSLQNRARISREWNKFFDQYPIILCPITGDIPFPDLKDLESEESFDLVFDSMLPQIAPPYMGLPGLSFATNKTKEKIGKFSPGKHIPIKSMNYFYENLPDVAFLFAWNHKKEIFEKEKNFTQKGQWIAHVDL